jgi:hypothetical protein
MSETTEEAESITITLNRDEAGFTVVGMRKLEKIYVEDPGFRALVTLVNGVDPYRLAQRIRRKVDETGCAAWGGEVETDYDDEEPEAEGAQ